CKRAVEPSTVVQVNLPRLLVCVRVCVGVRLFVPFCACMWCARLCTIVTGVCVCACVNEAQSCSSVVCEGNGEKHACFDRDQRSSSLACAGEEGTKF
uniref:Uncharacterized protein n=1 Tax=Anopheles arabiensis TaxID=7173 RepID=A0A182IGP3_ANOAR